MLEITRRAVAAAGLLILAGSTAMAQQPQTLRVRGTIESVDGNILMVKARDGTDVKVTLADNARVMALVKASIEDIRPNSYIGISAMPQPDGSQRALAIHMFPESMRGTGEGHRPWDLQPNSTMTNAAVDTMVTGVDGQTMTVKYKDGEKTVLVPPATPIVAYAPGDRGELKPGAKVIINGATRQADGSLSAPSIGVGRDGVTPPM
jgi:hypothetical protein